MQNLGKNAGKKKVKENKIALKFDLKKTSKKETKIST